MIDTLPRFSCSLKTFFKRIFKDFYFTIFGLCIIARNRFVFVQTWADTIAIWSRGTLIFNLIWWIIARTKAHTIGIGNTSPLRRSTLFARKRWHIKTLKTFKIIAVFTRATKKSIRISRARLGALTNTITQSCLQFI